MLVLRRLCGQWIDIMHRSGDKLRIRTYGFVGPILLAFDDDRRNFDVQRAERRPVSPQVRSPLVENNGNEQTQNS